MSSSRSDVVTKSVRSSVRSFVRTLFFSSVFLESGVMKVSLKCLECVWKVSGKCLEDVWKVSGKCLEGV